MAGAIALSSWEIDERMKRVLRDHRMAFLDQLETQVVTQAYPNMHQSVRDTIMQTLNNKGNFRANIELLDAIQRTENFAHNLLLVFDKYSVCSGLANLIRTNLPQQQFQANIFPEEAESAGRNIDNLPENNATLDSMGSADAPGSSSTATLDGRTDEQKATQLQESVPSSQGINTASSEQPRNNDVNISENRDHDLVNICSDLAEANVARENQAKEEPHGHVTQKKDTTAPSMLTTDFNVNQDETKKRYVMKVLPDPRPFQPPNVDPGNNNIGDSTVKEEDFDSCDSSDSSFYLDSKEMENLFSSSCAENTNDLQTPPTQIENLKHGHHSLLFANVSERNRSDSDISFKSCHSDESLKGNSGQADGSSHRNDKTKVHGTRSQNQVEENKEYSSDTEEKHVYEDEPCQLQRNGSLSSEEKKKEKNLMSQNEEMGEYSSDTEVKQIVEDEHNMNVASHLQRIERWSLKDDNTENTEIQDFSQTYVKHIIEAAQREVTDTEGSVESDEKDGRQDSMNRTVPVNSFHNEIENSKPVQNLSGIQCQEDLEALRNIDELQARDPVSIESSRYGKDHQSEIQATLFSSEVSEQPASTDYSYASLSSTQLQIASNEINLGMSSVESQPHETEDFSPPVRFRQQLSLNSFYANATDDNFWQIYTGIKNYFHMSFPELF